ncbi:hypothetical protein ABT023_19540 [Micromonospora sp. NPDC002296]|uniref:hypothetical protein n=1 Tax=Micromonospora sp. NPDC002296 TaxID=3154271 RepID=UPI00331BB5A5
MRKAGAALVALTVGLGVATSWASPALAAVAWEKNVATGGDVDNGHPKNCTDDDPFSHSVACWQPYGDVLWISNNSTIGSTPTAVWWNYYPSDSTLYRQGTCTFTFTFTGWGYCNKDMHEGSLIKLRVCDSPDSDRQCWTSIISTRA